MVRRVRVQPRRTIWTVRAPRDPCTMTGSRARPGSRPCSGQGSAEDVLRCPGASRDGDDAAHVRPHRLRDAVRADRETAVVAEAGRILAGPTAEPPRVV